MGRKTKRNLASMKNLAKGKKTNAPVTDDETGDKESDTTSASASGPSTSTPSRAGPSSASTQHNRCPVNDVPPVRTTRPPSAMSSSVDVSAMEPPPVSATSQVQPTSFREPHNAEPSATGMRGMKKSKAASRKNLEKARRALSSKGREDAGGTESDSTTASSSRPSKTLPTPPPTAMKTMPHSAKQSPSLLGVRKRPHQTVQSASVRAAWHAFIVSTLALTIASCTMPEPRVSLPRVDSILPATHTINIADINPQQQAALQDTGVRYNYERNDMTITSNRPDFVRRLKRSAQQPGFSALIPPRRSRRISSVQGSCSRGSVGSRSSTSTRNAPPAKRSLVTFPQTSPHPRTAATTPRRSELDLLIESLPPPASHQMRSRQVSLSTTSSVGAMETSVAAVIRDEPGPSVRQPDREFRPRRSTRIASCSSTTTMDESVPPPVSRQLRSRQRQGSASTTSTVGATNMHATMTPVDNYEAAVLPVQPTLQSPICQPTVPSASSASIAVKVSTQTSLQPVLTVLDAVAGPSTMDMYMTESERQEAERCRLQTIAEEASAFREAQTIRLMGRRVVNLFDSIMLMEARTRSDREYMQQFQDFITHMRQGFAQLIGSTTQDAVATALEHSAHRPQINMYMEAIYGLQNEEEEGPPDQELADTLDAVRERVFDQDAINDLTDRRENGRTEAEQLAHVRRNTIDQLQQNIDFIRVWTTEQRSDEEAVPLSNLENLIDHTPLEWENQPPPPVFNMDEFLRFENDAAAFDEFEPTAEQLADIEEQARDDAPHAQQVPHVQQPPRQVSVRVEDDGNGAAPFVLPPNARHYTEVNEIDIGDAIHQCRACKALHFEGEARAADGTYDMCCRHGQVRLPPPLPFPPYLRGLLRGEDVDSEQFFNQIHRYNMQHSLASLQTTTRLRANLLNPFVVLAGGSAYHQAPLPAGHDPAANRVELPNTERQLLFFDDRYNERLERGLTQEQIVPRIMGALANELARVNTLFDLFVRMGEVLREERQQAALNNRRQRVVLLRQKRPVGQMTDTDRRRYDNQQEPAEVAILAEGAEFPDNVILYAKHRTQGRVPVSSVNPLLDAMVYPLLFPRGDRGFHAGMRLIRVAGYGGDHVRTMVTRREFYAYKLFERLNHANLLHRARRLFQYYLVDAFMKIEVDRMRYIRTHQEDLRSASVQGLEDHLEEIAEREGGVVDYGRVVRIPQSFEGGTSCMIKRFLDGMALVRRYGHPDFFVTMTTNPNWREIQNQLNPGEHYYDRPDIVARVAKLRFKAAIDAIRRGEVLCPVEAITSSVEFQKRGLPHMHILIWCLAGHRIRSPEQVDAYVRATIPDKEDEEDLHTLVTRHMLHNACGPQIHGSRCMVDGKCSARFPFDFRDDTVFNDGNGHIAYRRPNDGSTHMHRGHLRTNQHVVPYNPTLLKLLGSHVNVEVCPSYGSLKYIFKYIFKGQDAMRIEAICRDVDDPPVVIAPQHGDLPEEAVAGQAAGPGDNQQVPYVAVDPYEAADVFDILDAPAEPVMDEDGHVVNPPRPIPRDVDQAVPVAAPADPNVAVYHDEANAYFNMRFVGSMEAAWRILGFALFWCTHTVLQLAVHDEGQSRVTFRPGQERRAVRNPKRSTLEAFMALNRGPHRAVASQYTYEQIPEHFRFDRRTATFRPRQLNIPVIGRLIRISPTNINLYHLYLLLLHRKGYRSFRELRTIDGVVHPDYRSACEALGLLRDDEEHRKCLTDAANTGYGRQTRRLFAHMVAQCGVNNPAALFDAVWQLMANRYRGQGNARLRTMRQVAFYLRRINFIPHGWAEMLHVMEEMDDNNNAECQAEDDEDRIDLHANDGDLSAALNAEQRAFYDMIMDKIDNVMAPDTTLPNGNLFYLCGAGGCGKTYLYRAICQQLTRQNRKFKCVSWTGISSQLLPAGSTCHYTFGLPMKLTAQSTSSVEMQSVKAAVLREAKVIIWDEVSMVHKEGFRIADELLRNLMKNQLPFGGKLVVVGGDFQQLLPVITNLSGDAAAQYSPCYSPLWQHFRIHELTENRRAAIDPAFAAYLATIGSGQHERLPGYAPQKIRIRDDLLVSDDEFVRSVFGDDVLATCADRAILTSTNADVMRLNEKIIDSLAGPSFELLSVDEPRGLPDIDLPQVPMNTIHNITPNGLPPHRLVLKPNAVVMLLRNIDVNAGLANGTRLKVVRLLGRVLECQILSGDRKDATVFIPRMSLDCDTNEGPCPFSRYQYPIRTAFAMTVNKSQGQTLGRVGIFLPRDFFTHGQLYVAMSRVASFRHLKFNIPLPARARGDRRVGTARERRDATSMTQNVVRREIIEMAKALTPVDFNAAL